MQPISGFSKLTKKEKINWLIDHYLNGSTDAKTTLEQYWNDDAELQRLHDEFSENTISNYYMPYGIAPNFLINGELKAIPMAIEESSVVAAASKAGKYWLKRGGFHTQILGNKKLGHVHFIYQGDKDKLYNFFGSKLKAKLKEETASITKNMEKRGGGILSLDLIDKTKEIANYYQLEAKFDTRDSMGANFINSCLEQFAKTIKSEMAVNKSFTDVEKDSFQIVMCILSNFTPENMVRAEVRCKVGELAEEGISAEEFVEKFQRAVRIAEVEPYRATTHNKGIMNGVDAVVIATGNDFRAVEACAHTYAAKDGKYQSLTHCEVNGNEFRFWIDLPMALGTVGGLTSLHPLVKFSIELLGKPNAQELMGIVAVAGLAQNFAALRSLTTVGIQKGHMKMHLYNILNQLGANEKERDYFTIFFRDKTVTHSGVVEEFKRLRKIDSLDELNN